MDLDEIVRRSMNTSFVEKDGLQNTPVYAAWIAVQLTKLAMALGENVKPERIAYTAEVLMEFEPLYLEYALLRARYECREFPVPCEVIAFLKEIPGWQLD